MDSVRTGDVDVKKTVREKGEGDEKVEEEEEEEEEEEGLGGEDRTNTVPKSAGDRARGGAVARAADKAKAKRKSGKGVKNRKR